MDRFAEPILASFEAPFTVGVGRPSSKRRVDATGAAGDMRGQRPDAVLGVVVFDREVHAQQPRAVRPRDGGRCPAPVFGIASTTDPAASRRRGGLGACSTGRGA